MQLVWGGCWDSSSYELLSGAYAVGLWTTLWVEAPSHPESSNQLWTMRGRAEWSNSPWRELAPTMGSLPSEASSVVSENQHMRDPSTHTWPGVRSSVSGALHLKGYISVERGHREGSEGRRWLMTGKGVPISENSQWMRQHGDLGQGLRRDHSIFRVWPCNRLSCSVVEEEEKEGKRMPRRKRGGMEEGNHFGAVGRTDFAHCTLLSAGSTAAPERWMAEADSRLWGRLFQRFISARSTEGPSRCHTGGQAGTRSPPSRFSALSYFSRSSSWANETCFMEWPYTPRT